MSDAPHDPEHSAGARGEPAPAASTPPAPRLPAPRVRSRRWISLWVWLIPLAAAIIAVVYYMDYRAAHAREIVIRFSTADGLKAGQTPVRHLGVDIGTVSSLELTADHSAALVHVALDESAKDFARAGTVYWIERADISAGSISGLTTVISGPYIEANPGHGAMVATFNGADRRPVSEGPGLRLVLHAARLGHLGRDSAIYFRGIQVGVVEHVQLNENASGVNIQAFVHARYAPLVRTTSQFWIETGIDVSGGIFSGLKLNVASVRALLGGAIAFATPDGTAPAAPQDSSFELNAEPEKKWLAWPSNIPLPPAPPDDSNGSERDERPMPALHALKDAGAK